MKDDIREFINGLEELKTKNNKGFNDIKDKMIRLTRNLSNTELKNIFNSITVEFLDR